MMGKTCSRVLAAFRAQKRMLLLGAIGAVLIIAFGLSEDWRLGIPPSFVMVWAGLLCGSGPVGRVHFANEFLLSRAVYRHEVFSASALVAFVNAILIASAMLVFPTWTTSRGSYLMLDVHPPALALTSWILIFAITWSVTVLLQVKTDQHVLVWAVALGVVLFSCNLVSMRMMRLSYTGKIPLVPTATASAAIVIALSAIAFISARWAFVTYCYTDPGAWTFRRGRATRMSATSCVHNERVAKGAAKPRFTIAAAGKYPATARYLRPLMWLQIMSLVRNPFYWCFAIVTAFSVALSVFYGTGSIAAVGGLCPYCIVISGFLSGVHSRHGRPTDHLFTLPLSRRLWLRIKVATGLLLLVLLIITFAVGSSLTSLSDSEDVSLLLPHGAAEVLQAHQSDETFHWTHVPSAGLLLVPKSAYGFYTLPSGRPARVLGLTCLIIVSYLIAWLLVAPEMMRGRLRNASGIKEHLSESVPIVVLMFFWFSYLGLLDGWTYALAYKHPVVLLVTTTAICAVLLRLAERQFVNLEVSA